MNTDDKTDVCNWVKKYVVKLVRFFDANELTVEEFCTNLLFHLVLYDRKCWAPLIGSLTPKNQSVLHAYCTANIGEGFEPPAISCLPGNATAEEVKMKCSELLPRYLELAEMIANHCVPR